MNKENYFIKQFKKSKIIGDDGAVIKHSSSKQLVYSADAFFENVHFKRSWMSLKQIAQKSMLVNISDAIVMNATPKYALLTVAIPPHFDKKELKQLASGFKKVAKQYNIEIIGGDTVSNEKLDISITIISTTNNPIYRSGIKKDHILCYTGTLGSVKKDLEKALEGKTISKKSKFIKPKLNPKFFYAISKYISAAMDISDGLGFELQRLSKINNIGFEFTNEISKEVMCSGEEYEILFSFNKKHLSKIKELAKQHNVKLNIFATANNKKYKHNCKEHHFEK
ncbi:MAG: thiamine-phosphate kinase [Campylobacteraceae bacterium]|jgi:thiamine-monophosphate kinase|nr:thiamine-phosphate kinase [Campylobacteraceae bacterium]MBT3881834.1 thiamine-phosphate kinase [Campylobacteraceae bacterium]MBT4030442.1 thiamine-phosphate kinase [Campylobacteraceae bacterium]MBT4179707.1 thiamine-phosphate kinase [Campylobacteraceae bacterium]MBT4571896.1 thiamine-phosphate kinase [Campylobacteraceae bacterium]